MKLVVIGSIALAVALSSAAASAQVQVAQFNGPAPSEEVGCSAVGLGDVDGDGLPDFATGGTWHLFNTTDPGNVYVCKGSTGSLVRKHTGEFGGDDFGYALANAGDVNGDGVADLLVGAPDLVATGGHDVGGTTAGRVELYSGATGALLLQVQGDVLGDMFGTAVTAVNDLDGDGVEDFAVGAIGFDGLASNGGMVRMLSGADGSTLWTRAGGQTNGSYGARLATVGDVNGDGDLDLAVTASNWAGAGGVFVHSGADGALLRSWIGNQSNIQFGCALAGIGDVDGDLVPDLAIGAIAAPQGTSKGTLFVHSIATGDLLYQRVGDVVSSYFGSSVAPIGDLDGDGASELAVGAMQYQTSVNASTSGAVSVLSGASGTELGRILGSQYERLGISVATLGDVQGDGLLDFVGGGSNFARVVAVDWPMTPSVYCTAMLNSQGCKPSISSTGTPTLSGADDFTVHGSNVVNQKVGLFLWGPKPAMDPFMGGMLCIGAPLKRSSLVPTGGSSGAPDCSGVMSYTFTHAYMQSQGLSAGSMFYVQGWYRDPAKLDAYIGLTNGLLTVVAP